MLLAYMRISTREQKFDLQRDALLAAGVVERYLYQDIASGAKQSRPGLAACLKALHPGDTLVVWKLDRVARFLLHLLEILQDLQERQVGFRILDPRAHLSRNLRFRPPANSGRLYEPDFDFLDEFFGSILGIREYWNRKPG